MAEPRGRFGNAASVRARRREADGYVSARPWVSAGNARSLRAFQAAGYRPVGSEALFLRP